MKDWIMERIKTLVEQETKLGWILIIAALVVLIPAVTINSLFEILISPIRWVWRVIHDAARFIR